MGETLAQQDRREQAGVAIYHSAAAILRPAEARIPELGRIRAGIKILKKQYNEQTHKVDLPPDPKDVKTYNEMLSKGARWDEIEKAIGPDKKGKTKLIPTNVSYFFIRPSDCVNPEHAKKLTELYGDKEDGGRVKAFPVVFYSDNIWDILHHEYACWGAESIKYRSQINLIIEDNQIVGAQRLCVAPPPPCPGVRPSGLMREWRPREEFEGICTPDKCKEYQNGECNLEGTIRCYIPGLKGHGLWQIKTHSWYGLEEIARVLYDVGKITHGRLRMLSYKGAPVFTLRKVQREIVQIDRASGLPKKRKQWLPILDLNIDEFQLAMEYEDRAMLARGRAAAGILSPGAKSTPQLTPGEPVQVPEPAEEEVEEGEIVEQEGADPVVEQKLTEVAEKSAADQASFRLVEEQATGGKQAEKDDDLTKKAGLIDTINYLKKEMGDDRYKSWKQRVGLEVRGNSSVPDLEKYVEAMREELANDPL